MIVKPRRVRSSEKFQPRLRSGSRQRQEVAASVMSTAVIQGFLSISLAVAALRSYQAVDTQASEASLALKLVMPVAFTLGALWCARLCVKNLRSGRSLWMMSRRSAPPPE